jgi:alpha-beta hydrolase superfamily lysophospholipase
VDGSYRVIIHGRIIDQAIDRSEQGRFVKEIVVTSGSLPLAMVRKRAAAEHGQTGQDGTIAPVLLVHGFGQNRYAWHLPVRSLANSLAHAGYDVFNLDLRGHGRSRQLGARRCKSVMDYVREDLPAAVEEVQALSGGRPVWLVGHSLGGLVSYAAAPQLDGAVAGLASMGSPYHFTSGSFSLSVIGHLVRMLGSAGVPTPNAPLSVRHVGKFLSALRHFADTPLYPIPWRGWHRGALEPDVLQLHLELAFDRAGVAELAELFAWGSLRRFLGDGSDSVDRFERLDLPLLVIAGTNDDLAPPASVRPAFQRSRARDKTYRTVPLGHIDLLVGRDAPLMTWGTVRRWLDARAGRGIDVAA